MAEAAAVELHDAVVVLGRFPALAGVTIDVAAGEIVWLRGPNGAGKTTLLKVCAGRLPLTRGGGNVLGCRLAAGGDDERHRLRERVGVLGHRNGLYLDLTVTENVRFWATTVGADHRAVDAALERLELGGRLADLPARRLSAGQARRCAFACFVVRRPHLWLLDEPHTGLDAASRDRLDEVIVAAAAAGATVLVASHDQDRASVIATRTVHLDGGAVASGEPGSGA